MKKTIVILANNNSNVLIQITKLLYKHHIKFDDFLSKATEKPGEIQINITVYVDDVACKKLRRRFSNIQDVSDVKEILE
ncbi:ACT domain-containing protein [Oceanobacillus sp. Castelsardo]|uniref:ACT domain-containing protein n=1 Tax=Oceanobacillus sp. Castelsardo TaxID=1851204 RepID=UPI00083937F5|nr:ACT domain-containing protein [Oceanobacillus sp. Castelsardo]